jgi:glycosyltransferase involved in cell wall biosynthesis
VSCLSISIITPSLNQGRFIARTVDSVLCQRGDFRLDYRVIDGGSTDGTRQILEGYGPRLAWVSEPDRGQIEAINKGLRSAMGEVVGWLNSDDVLLPGALDRVARTFQQQPRTEWVHGRCLTIDERDAPVRTIIGYYKHYRARRHSFVNLLTENYVSQMTAFWRRSVHADIGYLDPSLDLAFDYDLFLRLARRGPPAYIDEPLACFRWYDTSKSGANFRRQLDQASAVAARYGGGTGWTGLRTAAKRLAILSAYRLMKLATARR